MFRVGLLTPVDRQLQIPGKKCFHRLERLPLVSGYYQHAARSHAPDKPDTRTRGDQNLHPIQGVLGEPIETMNCHACLKLKAFNFSRRVAAVRLEYNEPGCPTGVTGDGVVIVAGDCNAHGVLSLLGEFSETYDVSIAGVIRTNGTLSGRAPDQWVVELLHQRDRLGAGAVIGRNLLEAVTAKRTHGIGLSVSHRRKWCDVQSAVEPVGLFTDIQIHRGIVDQVEHTLVAASCNAHQPLFGDIYIE